jgi:hypothetical protein
MAFVGPFKVASGSATTADQSLASHVGQAVSPAIEFFRSLVSMRTPPWRKPGDSTI